MLYLQAIIGVYHALAQFRLDEPHLMGHVDLLVDKELPD
jgi:hypothetical protein